MKGFKLKDILVPTVCLTVICIIVALALAGTNLLTADKIAANNEQKLKHAMAEVFPADDYKALPVPSGFEDATVYAAVVADENAGYVVTTAAAGYGGDITVTAGINADGSIKAVTIVSCDDETPGLGQNVKSDAFVGRFAGLSGKAVLKENVDAWTGATISSTAVVKAVNEALAVVDAMEGGSGK